MEEWSDEWEINPGSNQGPREEWELRSPKSYYLVDHAMTVHMTGPEFHRHYTELHRRGAGPSLSQTIRRQSSVEGSC